MNENVAPVFSVEPLGRHVAGPAYPMYLLKILLGGGIWGAVAYLYLTEDVSSGLFGDVILWTILTISCLFPCTRNIQALFSRSEIRISDSELYIRHPVAEYWQILPLCPLKVERVPLCEIIHTTQYVERSDFIRTDHYLSIACADERVIRVYFGIFNKSIDHLQQAVRNAVARQQGTQAINENNAPSSPLADHFPDWRRVAHRTRWLRLAGLVVGAPVGAKLFLWLYAKENLNTTWDNFYAVVVAGCFALTILGLAETVDLVRYFYKTYWFGPEGIVRGGSINASPVIPWSDVVGATRRISGSADRLNGTDILLADGSTIWIPESFTLDHDTFELLASR